MLPNIELKSKLLRGGRASLSPRTESNRVRNDRSKMLRKLIATGHVGIVERIRARELRIEEVEAAYDAQDLGRLTKVVGSTATLRTTIAQQLQVTKGKSHGSTGTLKLKQVIGRAMESHFLPDSKDRRLIDIGSEEIRDFLFSPKAKGKRGPGGNVWSPSRQEQARLFGKQVWDIAIKDEAEAAQRENRKPQLVINPWNAIRIEAAKGHDRVTFLTPEQWTDLEQTNRDLPELAMCALGCLGGLREGEAANLRTSIDVDLDADVLRVQPRKGKWAWRPKTRRSERVVPINDALRRILRRHIELGFAGDYLLHSARAQGPIGKTQIRNWTMKAYARAGIEYGKKSGGLTNHSLRHTFATWLVQKKENLLIIANLMGDTVDTIAKYYVHPTASDMKDAAHAIDRMLAA